jgi:hypothetical protein
MPDTDFTPAIVEFHEKRAEKATSLDAAGWSTYVRKAPSGRYEFGFVRRSDNFRKRADSYVPAGTEASISEAEAARERLTRPDTRPHRVSE